MQARDRHGCATAKPGIRAKLLPHLFDIFVHADSLRSRCRAFGIGLTLCAGSWSCTAALVRSEQRDGMGYGGEFIARIPLVKQSTRQRRPRPKRAAQRRSSAAS